VILSRDTHFKIENAPKWLEIVQDNLRTKLSALSVDLPVIMLKLRI